MRIFNARVKSASTLVDIEIAGNRISKISPSGPQAAPISEHDIDAKGRLVAPQFVESHIHLDYANTAGEPRYNQSGTLFEAIEIWRERKSAGLNNKEVIRQNAIDAARSAAEHGVGYIRTHVDVTDPDLVAFLPYWKLSKRFLTGASCRL